VGMVGAGERVGRGGGRGGVGGVERGKGEPRSKDQKKANKKERSSYNPADEEKKRTKRYTIPGIWT